MRRRAACRASEVVNASFDPATEDPNRDVGRLIEVEPD
jgi:hypothetical protein